MPAPLSYFEIAVALGKLTEQESGVVRGESVAAPLRAVCDVDHSLGPKLTRAKITPLSLTRSSRVAPVLLRTGWSDLAPALFSLANR